MIWGAIFVFDARNKNDKRIEYRSGGKTSMMMSNDIGIDLGTASILVYIKGKGVVLKEPSVVAIDRDTNKIMAIGEEARLMIGRTPGNIVAVRPSYRVLSPIIQ